MKADRVASVLLHLGFWIPLLACTYFALVPELPEYPVFDLSDVILHAAAFIYLSFALVLVFEAKVFEAKVFDSRIPEARTRNYLLTAGWMIFYGAALEVAQYFLPPRTAEWKDLSIDFLGICGGLLLARLLSVPVRSLLVYLLRLPSRF